LGLSHSLVLQALFGFFFFSFFSCFALSYQVPFPFLSSSFSRRQLHTSRQKEKRKSWVPADGPNGRQVQKKQAGPPGPCANFQEITMESMPVLPLEES
jgi:hypothetical protein